MTKHGLKTSQGIKDKKIEQLEKELGKFKSIKSKSPEGESLKETVRLVVSVLVGVGVTYLYQRFPFLGELQPDQIIVVTTTSAILVRAIDKYSYQIQKNHGDVNRGTGIDWVFLAFASVMERRKGTKNQISDNTN